MVFMDIAQATVRASRVAGLYDRLNQARGERVWSGVDLALGFVGDVGDLAKQVQSAEGTRSHPGGREALEHELADCLWSVLMLADRYDIDLGAAFDQTMTRLESGISAKLAELEETDS